MSCGANEHPCPRVFSQLFRLLVSYNLTKPAKGSNVSGVELLQPLIGTKMSMELQEINQTEWITAIDEIVKGDYQEDDEWAVGAAAIVDHNYAAKFTDDRIISYVSGFVVRNVFKSIKCKSCLSSFQDSSQEKSNNTRHAFTNLRCKGGLIRTSETVLILNELKRTKELSYIGCSKHTKTLTKNFIVTYLIKRGKMMCDSNNKHRNNKQKKATKFDRKKSKVVSQ